jgi:hypothetical protein
MKVTIIHQHNKPALIGFILLTFPVVFWLAVISEQLFHNEFLQEHLILKIDDVSSILSIVLFIIFPLIAFLINLFHIARLSIFKENNEWITVFRFQPVTINLAIIIFSFINIFILLSYSITENFIITSR